MRRASSAWARSSTGTPGWAASRSGYRWHCERALRGSCALPTAFRSRIGFGYAPSSARACGEARFVTEHTERAKDAELSLRIEAGLVSGGDPGRLAGNSMGRTRSCQ
jgi:hypothetical protein